MIKSVSLSKIRFTLLVCCYLPYLHHPYSSILQLFPIYKKHHNNGQTIHLLIPASCFRIHFHNQRYSEKRFYLKTTPLHNHLELQYSFLYGKEKTLF